MNQTFKNRSALVRAAERRNKREERTEKAGIFIIAAVIVLAYIAADMFGGVQ